MELLLLLRPRADAAAVLRKVDGSFARIRGVRLQGPTGVGEYRARAGMGLTAVIKTARAGFRQHHVVPPPLRGALVTVTAATAAQEQSRVRRLLGRDLESVTPRIAQHVPGTTGGGERQVAPGSTSAASTPALQASWAPTEWRGRTYKYQRVGDRSYLASALDMVFAWDPGQGHSPSNMPADWGVEIGIDLYGSQSGVTRPACLPGTGSRDPVYGFWASTRNYDWGTSVEDVAEPYLDTNRASDACNRNSLSFGIGQPRKLLTSGYRYGAWMDQDDGNQTTSKMSAGVQAVSNDCPFGIHANTDCMGLRSSTGSRPFPAGRLSVSSMATGSGPSRVASRTTPTGRHR